jgi:protein-S-isoprenylcysteine O-methyltransferase Ste14
VSRRARSVLGSLLFFCVAPLTVAGWVPYRLAQGEVRPPLLGMGALRYVGAALFLLGAAGLLECFARFALQGLGTPAPVAPTRHLVVTGLYRHVRNPMYVSVVAAILGQALWWGSEAVSWYAAAVFLMTHAFVLLYEEPALRRQFGAAYETYRANVRRWWPRVTPWRAPP